MMHLHTTRRVARIVLFATFAGSASSLLAETGANPREIAFARFKRLEGVWTGRSTGGWTDEEPYRFIAGGSVVMATSAMANAKQSMATMFHLDSGKLTLTHYCAAGNQPRLTVTEISDEGRKIHFTFRDATGLESRDQGHMDQVVFHFIDDDHFTEQWTWSARGETRWMEEISRKRK